MNKQRETSHLSIFHQLLGALFGRQPRNASEQISQLSTLSPPPRPEDFESLDEYIQVGWPTYWEQVGQSWRIAPMIDKKRQEVLNELRAESYKWRMYPFRNIEPKLTRADIEWLLATHENGRGFVDWRDHYQRDRKGLDLRGVNLSHENLHMLPLARMWGNDTGLIFIGNEQQLDKARVHLEWANLRGAHLEGAHLTKAFLAHADLRGAHLGEAILSRAHLESANLDGAHLEGANLWGAHLEGANLSNVFFDRTTILNNATFSNEKMDFVSLADVHWGDVNLSVIDWTQVKMLGDERLARHAKEQIGQERIKKTRLDRYRGTRLDKFRVAVRANRQLASVLRDRGLSEEANHFAYRAQILQKIVFRLQTFESGVKLRQRVRMLLSWIGSGVLNMLAGYGYRPWRSFLACILVITGFATVYYLLGHVVGPTLSLLGAIVFSMTSFHGRGFFPGGIMLDDPLTVFAAVEAFVGLLIEVIFIATLTQRLFGK